MASKFFPTFLESVCNITRCIENCALRAFGVIFMYTKKFNVQYIICMHVLSLHYLCCISANSFNYVVYLKFNKGYNNTHNYTTQTVFVVRLAC